MTERCPTCGDTLLFGREYAGGPLRGACKVHGFVFAAERDTAPITAAMPREGVCDPCAESPDAFRGLEKDLVDFIRKEFARRGWSLDVVGQVNAQGAGNSVGMGDLLGHKPAWPTAIWLAMEAKTHGGTFSTEQKERIRDGRLVPVWCVRMAIEAMEVLL